MLRFRHNWREAFGGMFTAFYLCLLIAGCSGEGSNSVDATHGKEKVVEDVRADTSVVVPWNELATTPGAGAEALASSTSSQSALSGLKVDEDGRRVFLPGTGWVTTDAFWEIYLNQPEKLPADLDHEALMAIRRHDE